MNLLAPSPVEVSPSRLFVISHLLLCSASWSGSFLFIKLMNGEVSPVVVASLRAVIGTISLLPVLFWMRQYPWPVGREWRDWAIIGTLNGWIPNILVAFALERMASGPAALIQASGPLMNALLAHQFLAGERLNSTRVAGLLIGLIGIAILIGPSALTGGATLLAVLAMFGLTLCYAIANVYVRRIRSVDPMRLAFGQQAFSTIFALPLALVVVGASGFSGAGPHVWLMLGLGVISTALPIAIFMRLLRAAGPAKASMTGYLVPVFAITIGVVVLDEPLLIRQIVGGVIVLTGVAIVGGLLRFSGRQAP